MMIAIHVIGAVILARGVMAQGVFDKIAPKSNPPQGCVRSMTGAFELSIDPVPVLKARAIDPDDPYVGQVSTKSTLCSIRC
jgi:hypothetical protein